MAGSYQNHYECHSGKSEKIYTVKLIAGLALCSCPDYEEQERQLGSAKVGCKHVIATLNSLGYGSLNEYIDVVSRKAKADLFGDWDEPTERRVEPYGDFIDNTNQSARKLPVVATVDCQKVQPDPFGGFDF